MKTFPKDFLLWVSHPDPDPARETNADADAEADADSWPDGANDGGGAAPVQGGAQGGGPDGQGGIFVGPLWSDLEEAKLFLLFLLLLAPLDKDNHKDKDKMTKRPNMCHIFENAMTQGCQI